MVCRLRGLLTAALAICRRIQAQMDQLNEQMDKTNLVVKEQKVGNT